MKVRSLLLLIALAVTYTFAATKTLIMGVALEAETDLPIKDVVIAYKSGKKVGETNSDGRFEYTVDSKNASLIFKKDGFDSVEVELQDYADLLDMVVTLSTNVRNLGASTIIGGGEEKVQWNVERKVNLDKLEDAAGMRFDLTEHLSQMPGISGQKDFSNALYYDGSRAGDVAYHLGRLRIPNMRHLDVGFPGNLSIVNPHVLSGIEIHDNYGEGPIGQGLATSVQYIPEQTKGDWGLKGSAGITMREVVVDAPWLFWDSFRFAFRMLDGDMLQNLGEKFFSEFRKRTDDCKDCKVKNSDPFDLNAMDFYTQLNGSDSNGNTWALRALYSSDDYSIHQDTSRTYEVSNTIDIIEGVQEYLVIGAEYASRFGTSFHAGFVQEHLGDTLRDTIGFRPAKDPSKPVDITRTFIDSYEYTHSTITAGADKNFGTFLGSELSGALLYEHQILDRSYPDFGSIQSDDYMTGVISGAARLNWKEDFSQKILSVGAVADWSGHDALPTASFDYQQNLSKTDTAYWRVFGNAAFRGDWKPYYDNGDLVGRLESGTSAKIGGGYNSKYLVAQASAFGRYYHNPLLPLPKAYAHYNDVTPIDYAWVLGASGSVEYKTSHHFSMAANVSSVYGEYELEGDGSLPWEANSRLDIVSHFRYYPRKDSIVSIILTHHAALHRPLYYYKITPSKDGEVGTRELKDLNKFTDMFRTDVRVNIDLTKKKFLLNGARFYLEVDNLFANLDVGALRFLGGENARERSWVTRDNDSKIDNGYELVPYMAKGMGLFVQFGVEVDLGL
ncbi:MAG: hypothetical protein MJZ05_05415 [Fibrobacter sp.]|nr:hypothetical protein [Fibrobacter sp.]